MMYVNARLCRKATGSFFPAPRPIVAYQLGSGWALSAGDLQFTCDWKSSRWVNIPIGFQIGKVTRLGSQPIRWAINPQYNPKDDTGLGKWKPVFTFTLLVPSD